MSSSLLRSLHRRSKVKVAKICLQSPRSCSWTPLRNCMRKFATKTSTLLEQRSAKRPKLYLQPSRLVFSFHLYYSFLLSSFLVFFIIIIIFVGWFNILLKYMFLEKYNIWFKYTLHLEWYEKKNTCISKLYSPSNPQIFSREAWCVFKTCKLRSVEIWNFNMKKMQ